MCSAPPRYPLNFSGQITIIRNEELGKGSYGKVFVGIYNGDRVAVKRIEHHLVDNREVEVQIQLRHENVVNILTVEEDLDFRYIVLELCAGSLQQVIDDKCYKGSPLPSTAKVLYEIANGLDYIHSQGMIHRDVKPTNILISLEGKIKISDFGMSKQITAGVYAMSGKRGHFSWMAPEVLRWCLSSGDESVENRFTQKSDIFCAGCVFFMYVAEGKQHPFGDNHIDRPYNITSNNIINGRSLPKDHFAASVILRMIKHDPEDRISLKEVKETLNRATLVTSN